MTTISKTITKDDIIVSGARSTGVIHIGNYFGAIRNFAKMIDDFENPSFFFIADWHALTTHQDAALLKDSVRKTLATYLGCGLDPNKSTIYLQSDVPAISELYLYLNMFAHLGELERTATFKEKIAANPNNINAGLLTYPVLMAADVLIHKGTKVPVGKDQAQHIEMIRTFSNRLNRVYKKEIFKEALAYSYSDDFVTVPSLNGSGKMSKSDDPNSAILLLDSDKDIEKKIKRAKTDTGPTEKNSPLTQEVKNLFDLMALFSNEEQITYFKNSYLDCSIRYGDLKNQLALDAIQFIRPLREQIEAYINKPNLLVEIAKSGAEKANNSANNTIEELRDTLGLTRKFLNKISN
jgi:tryptophanyl-tRNA synthetase